MDESSSLTVYPGAGVSGSAVAIPHAYTSTINDGDLTAGRPASTTLDFGMTDVDMNDFSTLDEFLADKIRENAGVQVINIRREEFATEVIALYLKGSINLYKEPKILFVGEPGRDFGALRREFFHEGMKAIIQGKYDSRIPIFDGEIDHKLPSVNAALLRGGVFEAVGKFLVHAIIHTGLSCIGLSEAVVEYLTCATVSTKTAFNISVKGVTQYEVRETLMSVSKYSIRKLPELK